MPLIRVQDSVPECYENQSRDFQLIGRLYDCVINGVKFDIDSMLNLTNTLKCNQRVLQLLQTKLGFFSDALLTDDELRYTLSAFPFIVKNKGSLKGIKQAVYVFLKANHLISSAMISIMQKDGVNPYSIVIGINSPIMNTTLLDEIFKYILPTGYTVSYMFYTNISADDLFKMSVEANAIFVSNTINSRVRAGTSDSIDGETLTFDNISDHLIGAVDTTEIISTDSVNNEFDIETYPSEV